MMRKASLMSGLLFAFLLAAGISRAQTPSDASKKPAPNATAQAKSKEGTVESRVEQYLRNLYAWGPQFELKVGPSKPSIMPDLLEVPVTVSMGGQSDNALVYVSKTGNFLVRGELSDMTKDPFADVKSKLQIGNSPSMGDPHAKVTLIEFADFECPACRQLDLFLRPYMKEHPEFRLVFKHYPLTEIHPWAMTAAIATQCAYHQSPEAFWKMHDAIFDAQELISPDNVWAKLQEVANQIGLDQEAYKSCIINQETAAEVKATIEEGHQLKITATPTTFINARRAVGPDNSLIQQFSLFE